MHDYPHSVPAFYKATNTTAAKSSSVCKPSVRGPAPVRWRFCRVQLQCTVTGIERTLRLTFKIVNTCLTQLASRPPFESSLHSQLWRAEHWVSLKHLWSWNDVWDLRCDYTGTSRLHILSHDFLWQTNLPLYSLGVKLSNLALRQESDETNMKQAETTFVKYSFQFFAKVLLLEKLVGLLFLITMTIIRVNVHIIDYWAQLGDSVRTDDNYLSFH